MMRRVRLILLYILALAVALIAARIEYLNVAAGHYLPRINPQDTGKWRSTVIDEPRWRQYYGPRDGSGAPAARDLTVNERRQMNADIARMNAIGQLRDWVSSAGLLRYLLLPALILAAGVALAAKPTRSRMLALSPVAVVIIFASASLWYRGYFSSLEP